MSAFRVYSTESDADVRYPVGTDESADDLIQQLTRSGEGAVDLYVDQPAGRVGWAFYGADPTTGNPDRFEVYFAEYRADDATAHELFAGLRDGLAELESEADPAWRIYRDPSEEDPKFEPHPNDDWGDVYEAPAKWRAGFELSEMDDAFPGHDGEPLDPVEQDDLVGALLRHDGQLHLGMASYEDALSLVWALTDQRVDASIAINTDGATSETAGVDLVVWPVSEWNYRPMDESSRAALVEAGFVDDDDERATVPEGFGSKYEEEIGERDDIRKSVESFGDSVIGGVTAFGRVLAPFIGGVTLLSLGGGSFLHPLSGISALGGLLGGTLGVFGLGGLVGRLRPGGGSAETEPADEESDERSGSDGDTETAAERSAPDGGEGAVDAGGSSPGWTPFDTDGWGISEYSTFVGLSLLLGMAFPTAFRSLVYVPGMTRWWWDGVPPVTLASAGTKAIFYVYALLFVGAIGRVVWRWALGADTSPRDLLDAGASLLPPALFFWLGLVVSNGLSCRYWYDALGVPGAAC